MHARGIILATAILTAAGNLTACGSQDGHACDAAPAPGAPASIALALAPMKTGGGGGGGGKAGGSSSSSSGGSKAGTSSGSKAGSNGTGAKPGTSNGTKPGGVGTSARPGYTYAPGLGRPLPPRPSFAPVRPIIVNHYTYAPYGYYMPSPYGGLWPYWVLGASTHEEQDPCT